MKIILIHNSSEARSGGAAGGGSGNDERICKLHPQWPGEQTLSIQWGVGRVEWMTKEWAPPSIVAVSPLRLETPRYDGGACGGAPKKRRAPPLVHEERNVIPFPPGSSIVSRSMASASSEGFARFMMGRARESNMRPRDPSPPPSFVPFSFRSFHSSFLLTQSTPTEGSEGAEGGGVEQETRVTGGSFTHYAPFGAEEWGDRTEVSEWRGSHATPPSVPTVPRLCSPVSPPHSTVSHPSSRA